MKTLTEILEDLELLYEKNQLPTVESSVEPNGGVLNLDKVLQDNPECWDTLTMGSSQLEKKTIILNCDLKSSTVESYLKQRVIKILIEDGFTIYVPTLNGLTKLDNKDQLFQLLTQYSATALSSETAELRKLNLIGDRVAFLNDSRLDELCTKILNSPDAFFNFINCIILDEPDDFFSDLEHTEMTNSDLQNALGWSFDDPPNLDDDWEKKYSDFEKDLSEINQRSKLSPPFLPSDFSEYSKDGHYFNYLMTYRPDVFKKLRHITLANRGLSLFSFLNQRESLLSLSLKNCEIKAADDEPLLTTSLRFLNTYSATFTPDSFEAILNNSPNLTSLCMSGGEIDTYDATQALQLNKLTNLRNISLEQLVIPRNQLNDLLNEVPNLIKLVISNISIDKNESEIRPLTASLPHLKELSISSSLDLVNINSLLNASPNLETLSISKLNEVEFIENPFLIVNSLKALKTISLTAALITPGQLVSLLQAVPHLTELNLDSCYIAYFPSALKLNSLPHLRKLTLGIKFAGTPLQNFLTKAPNVNELIIETAENFLYLQSGSLPSLNHITIKANPLSFSELAHLIKIAPNIKSISYPNPVNKNDLIAAQWFHQNHPQIEMVLLEEPVEGNHRSTSNPAVESFTLDGKIGKTDKMHNLLARILFKAKSGQNPQVSQYHLNEFYWHPFNKKFRPQHPLESNLVSIPQSLESYARIWCMEK